MNIDNTLNDGEDNGDNVAQSDHSDAFASTVETQGHGDEFGGKDSDFGERDQPQSAQNTAKGRRTWSISELSKEFDITTRSIRFYEDQGLIKPTRRGQTRIYNRGDRVRLKLVLRGKRLGFSLAETLRLFELYDSDKSSATQLKSMLTLVQDKKAHLHQQMDDIKVLMMELVTVEKRCIQTLASLTQEGLSKND